MRNTGIVHTVSELLPIAVEAVDRANKIIRERSPGAVMIKGDRDPATEVDFIVEREVRSFLLDRAPEVGFLGEEDGHFGDSSSGFMWALDPIDGTVNYIQGIPLCAVSLGLVSGDKPVLGLIDLPFLSCRYSALLGAGAFLGERPITAARTSSLTEAVVALGDFAVGEGAAAKNAERVNIVRTLASAAERVRMLGSAAIDLAWVAEGRIDASVMLSNKPWDTAAGVLLAREAGAHVSDRHGLRHTVQSDSTVAGSPSLVSELVEIIGGSSA